MPAIRIPCDRIVDWATFHAVFAEVLHFPEYYGRNMDAWIDCLTYADDSEALMISPITPEGDVLTLKLEDVKEFAERCPEQYAALIECSAFVNYRRIEIGERPILALAFHY
jgi:hypothetical protein